MKPIWDTPFGPLAWVPLAILAMCFVLRLFVLQSQKEDYAPAELTELVGRTRISVLQLSLLALIVSPPFPGLVAKIETLASKVAGQ